MQLSNRLKKIADEVKFTRVADIGTDHAYIPIYLCQNRTMKKVLASDVNKQPIEKAKHNINTYRLEEKIETRIGNGLEKIKNEEVETVIISGMGGLLITDILNKDIKKIKSFKQLILQPQTEIHRVRKYLHEIGFKIANELMLYEDSKFYTIINAEQGADIFYTEHDYLFGKILIEQKNKILKQFLESEMEKQKKIQFSLEAKETESAKKRLKEISDINNNYMEVYKCL